MRYGRSSKTLNEAGGQHFQQTSHGPNSKRSFSKVRAQAEREQGLNTTFFLLLLHWGGRMRLKSGIKSPVLFMPILVACPECKAKLNAPDHTAGKRISCPKCKAIIFVPPPLVPQAAPTPDSRAGSMVKTEGHLGRVLVPQAAPRPEPPDQPIDKTEEDLKPVHATDYRRMKWALMLIRARQEVRTVLDISGFGPSASGRLCFAMLICVVLFGISLIVSFARNQSPPLAIAQGDIVKCC
jgi:hypothetical protein